VSLPETNQRIIAGWLLDHPAATKATTLANYGKTARLAARDLDLITCDGDQAAAAVEAVWSTDSGRRVAMRILRRLFRWMAGRGLRPDNPVPAASGAAGFGPVRDEWVPDPWTGPLAGWVGWLVAAGRGSGTVYVRTRSLVRFARANPGGPRTVGPQQVVDWFAAHARWAPATRRRELAALTGFWRWAVGFGHADHDPTGALGPFRVPPGVPRPVDDEPFRSALGRADDDVMLMILLGAHAGLRRAEIAAVHSRDITDAGLVVTGKGGRRRLVPLSGRLRADLARRPDGWVFPGRFGGHLHPTTVGRKVSTALREGGTTHMLRHRFGTRAVRGTHDLRAVQTLMGHSSPATTALYDRVGGEDLIRAVEAAAA
jgi:integrase